MATSSKHPRWLDFLGIGGISAILGFGGFVLWISSLQKNQLVLRDEVATVGVPPIFILIGFLLSLVALWLLKRLAALQNREVGWRWKTSGLSFGRGASPQWEDMVMAVVMGVTLGTVGILVWLNCRFDSSQPRSYSPTILSMNLRNVGNKGSVSFFVRFTDWKKPEDSITITVKSDFYAARKEGDKLFVSTRKGLFGYEWFTSIK